MFKGLVISDNTNSLKRFVDICKNKAYKFDYKCSQNENISKDKIKYDKDIKEIKIKKERKEIINNYNLVISLHCKQIFPKYITESVRCVNIHPGYNPYNKGVFPQVFSIINGDPCGVTIHEMDEKIDNGPIIDRKKVDIKKWDTSEDVYRKIINLEENMIKKNIDKIVKNNYDVERVSGGSYNSYKDFEKMCKIDLQKKGTFEEFIDRLRALTHGNHKNAYFEGKNGDKVYIQVRLDKNGQ